MYCRFRLFSSSNGSCIRKSFEVSVPPILNHMNTRKESEIINIVSLSFVLYSGWGLHWEVPSPIPSIISLPLKIFSFPCVSDILILNWKLFLHLMTKKVGLQCFAFEDAITATASTAIVLLVAPTIAPFKPLWITNCIIVGFYWKALLSIYFKQQVELICIV